MDGIRFVRNVDPAKKINACFSFQKMPPKTPRTKAANLAPTTGHVASPLTIVIRKKIAGTPGPLPRKGRKSMGMKKSKVIISF